MLNAKYPDSGIILGEDKNKMDIRPLLNSPSNAPPIKPDDPNNGKPSDHSVPVCISHTDRYSRPVRTYRLQKYPQSRWPGLSN